MNQIREYDEMIVAETLHPLVNVVDFSRLLPIRFVNLRRVFGYYAIYLKGPKYTELHYGRSNYAYSEGALVFFAPGQVAGSEEDGELHQVKGHVLMFHPDLLAGTYLQPLMERYSFFSYDIREALLPTEEEKATFIRFLRMIEGELRRGDEHSLPIVIDLIKTLLDYCNRFYDRQFHARQTENRDVLARFERLLDDYYKGGEAQQSGLPTVQYCADKLCLSTNYFSDLIRRETGVSASKHIQQKLLDLSKALLAGTPDSVGKIAETIGFQYSQHFSQWFKKMEGCSPNEYRRLAAAGRRQ